MKVFWIILIIIGVLVLMFVVYKLTIGKKKTTIQPDAPLRDASILTASNEIITINPDFLPNGGLSGVNL